MDPFTPLFGVLRQGREHVKMAIECWLPSTPHKSPLHQNASHESHGKQRIFAVVTNVDKGYEEACVFVLKRRRREPNSAKVVDGLPITQGFQASVKQIQDASRDKAYLQIDLSLSGKSLSAVSDDAQAIRDLVTVIRESEEQAKAHISKRNSDEAEANSSEASHQWVESYLDVGRPEGVDKTPIFSRFTSSSFAPSAPHRSASPAEGEIKIAYGTWNVNGQIPPKDVSLSPWLNVDEETDILIVGLQEAESSGLSYVVWTPHVEEAWTVAIEEALGRQSQHFQRLASKQLVGVLLLVYVRNTLRPRISAVNTAAVGVGFGGWAANKGAVAIRFTMEGKGICIVSSHLSAFDTVEARERRRWDYQEITKRLQFSTDDEDSSSSSSSSSSDQDNDQDHKDATPKKKARKLEQHPHLSAAQRDAESMLRAQLQQANSLTTNVHPRHSDRFEHGSIGASLRILDHDVVLWGGDLNWRLELSTSEVKRLIRERHFESTLLKYDQLRSEIQSRTAFDHFQEQAIR